MFDEDKKFSVGFTEHKFLLGEHICSFYEKDKERMNVIIPYLITGLESKQKCICIFSNDNADVIQKKLKEEDFGVEDYLISNQLLFFTQDDFFLNDEGFDPDKTIEILKKAIFQSQKEKWQALRVIGEWAWLLKKDKDYKKWIDYEARVSYDFSQLPVIILCLYDQKKLDGDFLINLIKTHPFVTMGSDIYVNPFYKASGKVADRYKSRYYV